MKRILAASVVSCLALAGPAAAENRCDAVPGVPGVPAEGAGAEVLVRYPVPHPDTEKHDNKHIVWLVAPPLAVKVSTLGYYDPRIIGVGDFVPGGPCELLWEEFDADHGPALPRIAFTEGFVQATPGVFEGGVQRPPLEWEVAGTYDVTGDGRADVLWWNSGTGGAFLWVRTDAGWTEAPVVGSFPTSPAPDPAEPTTAVVRFVPDGLPGVIWLRSGQDSPVYYYETKWNGQDLTLSPVGIVEGVDAPGWNLAAVGDFDRDGVDDLMQRHDAFVRVCYMAGLAARGPCTDIQPGFATAPGEVWAVAGPR